MRIIMYRRFVTTWLIKYHTWNELWNLYWKYTLIFKNIPLKEACAYAQEESSLWNDSHVNSAVAEKSVLQFTMERVKQLRHKHKAKRLNPGVVFAVFYILSWERA